jgi:putative inorganic carbon (hco3(-)) transporter
MIPVATLLAWATSPRRDLGAQSVLVMCAGPLLAWVAASLLRTSCTQLVTTIAAAGIFESLIATAQWLFGFDVFSVIGRAADVAGRMRVYGTLGNPDFLAIFVAVTIPALLTLARRSEGTARWICWGGIVLDVIALGGAGSRTGIVAAMCGCAAALLLDGAPAIRRVRTVVLFCAILAIAATALAWRNPRTAGTAARGRVFTWRVSLVDAANRPLGDGPGTFSYRYPAKLADFVRGRPAGDWQRFIGYERTANNDFVQAIAETGWPGAAALIAVFALTFARLRQPARVGHSAAIAAFGVVTALAAAGLTESPLQRAETWALFWLCVGIAIAGNNREPHQPASAGAISVRGLLLRAGVAALLTLVIAWLAIKPVLATHSADAGATLESEHRYPEAVAAYRRSIQFDPAASSAAFNLPRALVHTGDLDAAIAAANDGLRWIDEPELRLIRLRILETRGDYVSAMQAAAADVQRFPYSPELQQEFVHIASRLQSW